MIKRVNTDVIWIIAVPIWAFSLIGLGGALDPNVTWLK